METITHLTNKELEAGMGHVRQSPQDGGMLAGIVRRPGIETREELQEGKLNLVEGLAGDNWSQRPSSRTKDNSPHPDMQLTLMNLRILDLIAQDPARRPLAGDQLLVDLDLSHANLPAGTQLAIGSAIVEVTKQPHTGCKKFRARFGLDALKFVNSPEGKQLRLRGLNAKVIRPGTIQIGNPVHKIPHPETNS